MLSSSPGKQIVLMSAMRLCSGRSGCLNRTAAEEDITQAARTVTIRIIVDEAAVEAVEAVDEGVDQHTPT